MKQTKVGIAVFDLHYPMHDKKLWSNILKWIRDNKPEFFVFGGDNMDMTAVSHWLHEGGQFRTLEGRRISKEYDGFKRDILGPLEEVLGNAKRIWLYGNHEDWVTQAIDKNPQGEGFWEVETNLDLSKWFKVPYGKTVKVGKMVFLHGAYTNDAHAKKTVTTYEKNVFYGHDHTYQAYTKTTPLENESHIGVSVPCACHLNPDYMRNKPNRWLNGFLVFEVFPNGCFQDYIIKSLNGRFVYHGKVYQ